MSDRSPLEIARRLVELGEAQKAGQAYALALEAGIEDDPAAELEAAVCVLQFGGNYRLSYKALHSLHNRDLFQEETFSIMTGAFYEPNVKDLRSRYERNCKRLNRYPYFFRKDFVPFEELPILFYPYDDGGSYIPYYPAEDRFGELIDFKEPVVRHYFFKDLENPILAEDIFSQYELEYLNDNVRKSEYVARENHIYLHYTNWAVFCAYLQCWNLNALLDDEKFVFLMEDEISQYPIDFKARFGIDYSQFKLKPIGIREVNRLIWHTQLSAHNGGDFFNEVLDAHPNLLIKPSIMMDNIEDVLKEAEKSLKEIKSTQDANNVIGDWNPDYVRQLYLMKGRTDKDLLVSLFLNDEKACSCLDYSSRIAPAIFLQPHFSYIDYQAEVDKKGRAVLISKEYDRIHESPLFRYFKYIKTFTPMRRMTTSYGGTIKFMLYSFNNREDRKENEFSVIPDVVFEHITNRSYMRDPEDRLFKDSVLVRFEDGKLNPKATFTALAEFLDLPYTETLTYCSEYGEHDPVTEGNAIGFDPVTVYRAYDEYANDAERTLIEYFCRDTYENYGYSFHYYDGGEMDEERIKKLVLGCTTLDGFVRLTMRPYYRRMRTLEEPGLTEEELTAKVEKELDDLLEETAKGRLRVSKILMGGLNFINRKGQPLEFMPKLELDPALLEAPIYH